MFTRTRLIIAAMSLLSVLTVGGRGQSPNAQQRKDEAAMEKQEQAIVVKITPVGFSRKSVDYIEKLQFKVGEPVRIAVELTNTTEEPLVIAKGDSLFYYRPRLLKDGQLVEYRKEIIPDMKSKDISGPSGAGPVIGVDLEPHKLTGETYINLSLWYGSLEPGHYQLTVGHRFRHKGQHNQSNTVTFDVVPAM